MKRIIFSIIILISFLFISCGGDIKISIFTRDLTDVMTSNENIIYTNVNMIVESLEDENDIEFLRRNLNSFSNEHTVEYNYSTSLCFDIKAPIILEGTKIDTSKDLIIITGKRNGKKMDFYLEYNKDLFSRINNYIYNKHYQNIDIKEFKLKIEVNNDVRKTVSFSTFSSYINGKPYPFEHKQLLKERDRFSFEVSEIFSKYISEMDDENYPLFSIE